MARFLPLVALFFASIVRATAAVPAPLPVGSSLGLQMTLVTGASRFEIPSDPSQLTRAERRRFPYAISGSFTATAALTNLSRSPLALAYPSPLAANARFHFTLQNASGQTVWESDGVATAFVVTDANGAIIPAIPDVNPAIPTVVTVAPRSTLRRTIQVPLKSSDGQWLPGGRYHLRAEGGTGEVLASVPIEIVAPPLPEGTGIQGQVFFRQLNFPGPIIINPPVRSAEDNAPSQAGLAPGVISVPGPIFFPPGPPVASEATVYISEIREPNARYDHPAFSWTGRSDAQGRFHVATPAGRFHLFARIDGVSTPPTLLPTWLTVTVSEGRFTSQDIYVVGTRVTPKELAFRVDQATGVPVAGFVGQVLVTAKGAVSSGGWTGPALAIRPSTAPDVIDLDFVATPPDGIAAQVISPVTAQKTVAGVTNSTVIRIHSSTNTVTVLLSNPSVINGDF